MKRLCLVLINLTFAFFVVAQVKPADNGDGTYTNPILHADYSDPDAVKVGDDFYMTASSFGHVPGLPILHSKDLVNWELVNYAIIKFNDEAFETPQHGNAVWAPSIRYHNGEFYIFCGDPDRGIFYVKTKDPSKEWSKPYFIKKAHGNIDPCPIWDEDGKVYMVHAFAHSRAGIKSVLQVNELEADLSQIKDKGTLVFDGHVGHSTIEGPKFYKRNGYYYIFAPAGGVATGWQTVLRSKNIYGPYEDKIVMVQGNTAINGPHQGAYIELDNGEGWFLHFQDKEAYGRIVHLQPVKWVDDWPVIGADADGDGVGVPVITHKKPNVKTRVEPKALVYSDEFESDKLQLQWQWQANPQAKWYSLGKKKSTIRLHAVSNKIDADNLWFNSNLLLEKFPAPNFEATTQLTFTGKTLGDMAGLTVFGMDWSALTLTKKSGGTHLQITEGNRNDLKKVAWEVKAKTNTVYLKVEVYIKGKDSAICTYSYSFDNKNFQPIKYEFSASPGRWVGAKIGVFCTNTKGKTSKGFADFDWFRVKEK